MVMFDVLSVRFAIVRCGGDCIANVYMRRFFRVVERDVYRVFFRRRRW